MPYTFAAGDVATKERLDSLLPPTVNQAGVVQITPVANTPTSIYVAFPTPFASAPRVLVTAQTIYIGSVVKGVGVSNGDRCRLHAVDHANLRHDHVRQLAGLRDDNAVHHG